MKVCIIHGSPRKGNTYKAAAILKDALDKQGKMEYQEYFLPKDMSHFCCGCYNCFDKGEAYCPHEKYIQPIAEAMRSSDGIIITSPVYVLSESAEVKALLDHFGYMFLNHRPMEEMFQKTAMVISTTAGAGTDKAMKTIARSLSFWGVKRIDKAGFSLMAKEWEEMKTKKQEEFEKILHKKAVKFYKSMAGREKLQPRLFVRFFFSLMKRMQSSNPDSNPDKMYWIEKGWLDGKRRPF